jgi:hypothetical protein
MRKNIFHILLAFVFACTIITVGWGDTGKSDTKSGEEINWQVISSGGSQGSSSTNFQLSGTTGQTAVGVGSSTNFGLNHGYWQDFGGSSGPCDCEPGEMNADGVINIFDVTGLISYLYLGGSAPTPYALCNGDMNKDCVCNIFDVTGLISFLYLGGPPPCTCNEWLTACGPPLRK